MIGLGNNDLNSGEFASAIQGVAGLGFDVDKDGFEPTGTPGVYQMKSTGRQGVRFYWKEFYNQWATEQEKKKKTEAKDFTPVIPVYDKVLMIEIHTPGEGKPWEGRCEEYHKRTYFQQYQRFMQGKSEVQGTPIENAEFLIGPEAMDLRVQGVKTIEMLADASDHLCETMPRGYELREHAKMWRNVNHGNQLAASTKKLSAELSSAQSTILALQKENERRDREMNEMREMVRQMSMPGSVPVEPVQYNDDVSGIETVEPVNEEVEKRRAGRPRKHD